jgi:hypothetical protein
MLIIILLLAPLAASLTILPGVELEIINKTILATPVDAWLVVKVNNTKLSQIHGEDVYTIAIVNYQFQCSVKGNRSIVYTLQTPVAVQRVSLGQEAMSACLGEEMRITRLNATFIVMSRGGRHIATYYADLTEAVKNAVYIPEWRALAFKIETGYVDRCNWVQYDLKAKYGGVIGVVKITSWDCFNASKALRVAYQPYYHYLTKYVKVTVRIQIENATMEKDLTKGGELILPTPRGPYGEAKNFTIEVAGPQDRYLLRPMEHTGPIRLMPPSVEYRGLAGVITAAYQSPPFYVFEILLNDTVTPEGLHLQLIPTPPPYLYCEVKAPNRIAVYMLAQTPGAVQGSLVITYLGPGVVKQGQITIPPTPIQPVNVTTRIPPVKVTYHPIRLDQPQPLITIAMPTLPDAFAAYVEVNVSITPRDPHVPVSIYLLAFVNKTGVLTPLPPGVLRNSTTPGVYKAYLNGTIQLKWLIPTPPGDSLVVYIYGDNIAKFKVLKGRSYVLTVAKEEEGSALTPMQMAAVIIVLASGITASVLSLVLDRRT